MPTVCADVSQDIIREIILSANLLTVLEVLSSIRSGVTASRPAKPPKSILMELVFANMVIIVPMLTEIAFLTALLPKSMSMDFVSVLLD